jgi:hypothetical protein
MVSIWLIIQSCEGQQKKRFRYFSGRDKPAARPSLWSQCKPKNVFYGARNFPPVRGQSATSPCVKRLTFTIFPFA